MITVAVHRKVSLVIRLIDRFGTVNITHALVAASAATSVATQHKTVALNKKNGYYVFIDLHPSENCIYIQASGYETEEQIIEANQWYETGGPLIVNMRPVYTRTSSVIRTNGVLRDTAGNIAANTEFYYAPYPLPSVTLLQNIKKGEDVLCVNTPRWLILDGQIVTFDGKSDFYRVKMYDTDNSGYYMDRPLTEDGFPMGCGVVCVYPCVTDAEGRFEVYSHPIYSSGVTYYMKDKNGKLTKV